MQVDNLPSCQIIFSGRPVLSAEAGQTYIGEVSAHDQGLIKSRRSGFKRLVRPKTKRGGHLSTFPLSLSLFTLQAKDQEGRTPLHYAAALHDSGIFYRFFASKSFQLEPNVPPGIS